MHVSEKDKLYQSHCVGPVYYVHPFHLTNIPKPYITHMIHSIHQIEHSALFIMHYHHY